VFYKKKRYRYEEELGSKKYGNRSAATTPKMFVGIS
jgi:hypothetical protein